MAQLGSGNGSTWPQEIDTAQTWVNASSAAPDSNTRFDSEMVNDFARAIVALETYLGANPQGVFGSIAARLNQFLPGGGASPAAIPFTNATTVSVPGTVHRLGTSTILYRVYDASIPAEAVSPEAFTVTVNPATYDVLVTFATPQSGFLVLSAASPLYMATFTSQTTLNIAGAAHGLGTADLFWQIFDASDPREVIEPATFTVDGASNDVAITFDPAASGTVLLSAAGPRFVQTFNAQTTVTVSGATHGLGTQALLWQIYDNGSPRAPVEPESLSVDPVTYNVVVTFATAQSGRLVLAAVPAGTGSDFEIRDAGIVNTSATIVKSASGNLNLQQGSGNHVYIRDKTGAILVTIDNAGNVGLGTTTPGAQLDLSTDTARKLATSTWQTVSDEKLKQDIEPFLHGLATVLQLEPVWFRYNGKGGTPQPKERYIGVIAQAVQAIAPYMVRKRRGRLHVTDSEETELLDYDGHAMTFVLINAMKELTTRLVTVEARCEALERAAAASAAAEEEVDPC